eukprot:TRINITY_DN47227_c0_g1_i1.p1 TRINITY_DN47227_c0_g1~~TRINITY_DN47227_c0_g1_i1.p1  ORF type:complete len:359 (+),score=113.47 TRINITY_DN47227_c0_g1_i1:102-1079(+)
MEDESNPSQSTQLALAAIGIAVLAGMFGTIVLFMLRTPSDDKKKTEVKSASKGSAAAGRKRSALDRMQRGAASAAVVVAPADDRNNDNCDEEEESADDGNDDDRASRRNEQKEQRRQKKIAQQAAERQQREAKTERQTKYGHKQKEKEVERERLEREEKEAREAKERQDKEDFEKWKDMIVVDAEGEEDSLKEENTVERFIDYIKMRKVVNLEDVAAAFKMRNSAAIERIKQLEKLGRISGIFDDRGKFIYITDKEMKDVAAWLKKNGRISRADLAVSCNKLIRLNPTEEDKAKLEEEARSAAKDLEENAEGGEGAGGDGAVAKA